MTYPFCGRDEGKERPQQGIMAISTARIEHLARRVANKPPGSGESPNHPPVPWLKTVVLNGAGKVGTGSRQVWTGEMGDGRELASAVRSAEKVFSWHQNQGLHDALG